MKTKVEEKEKTNDKKSIKLKQKRRNNAKLYPIYKMFSWDLLCFYPIEYLFYTITKGIQPNEVLIITAAYIISKVLMQIPAVIITDIHGKRKSLIFGNMLIFLYVLTMIITPGMWGLLLANFISALGYDIKSICEGSILYESVSTKGGEGLYTKIDSNGGSLYYCIEGILGFIVGYLFVINNYLPVFICLGFSIISVILSFGFKDIYKPRKKENTKATLNVLRSYRKDLSKSVKFIIKSERMKAYILFGAVFYGIIKVIATYKSNILVFEGISEEQYSMIFAIFSLIAGVSLTFSKQIHKKFRNKTLTVLSLTYCLACIIIGTSSIMFKTNIAIPIIILMLATIKIEESTWWILEGKYLNNFTTPEIRNRIKFTYQMIVGIVSSMISLIGSLIIKIFNIQTAFLIVALLALMTIVLVLDYMRKRIGLKPSQYKKQDILF